MEATITTVSITSAALRRVNVVPARRKLPPIPCAHRRNSIVDCNNKKERKAERRKTHAGEQKRYFQLIRVYIVQTTERWRTYLRGVEPEAGGIGARAGEICLKLRSDSGLPRRQSIRHESHYNTARHGGDDPLGVPRPVRCVRRLTILRSIPARLVLTSHISRHFSGLWTYTTGQHTQYTHNSVDACQHNPLRNKKRKICTAQLAQVNPPPSSPPPSIKANSPGAQQTCPSAKRPARP